MGNNVCTDGVPFTVSDLQYTPDAGSPSSALLSGDNLISPEVVQSFRGFDHNLKALRLFYRDPARAPPEGRQRRRAHRADRRENGRHPFIGDGAHGDAQLPTSNAAAAEHTGIEPVHLSGAHVPVLSDSVYLLIHVQRSTPGSAPPTSRGPSPREMFDSANRPSGTGSPAAGSLGDSAIAPAWARGMSAVFTARGLGTAFARSTPRPSLQPSPRWSARRMQTTAELANAAHTTAVAGQLEPSPQLVSPWQQQQPPPSAHARPTQSPAAAYEYQFSLHLLTGKASHPLVAAMAVKQAFNLGNQLKEHPEQLTYLFYNVNRSRLVSGERGGSRTSRRARAILTVTSPCFIGRLAWPADVGNAASLPAQRLHDACRLNAVLRYMQSITPLSGPAFSPRAVSTSGTSVSSTSASPRSAGRVLGAVGTTRGVAVPSAAHASRIAASAAHGSTATSNHHNSNALSGGGGGGGAQQGPPTFSIPLASVATTAEPHANTTFTSAAIALDPHDRTEEGEAIGTSGGRHCDPAGGSYAAERDLDTAAASSVSSGGSSLAANDARSTDFAVTAVPSRHWHASDQTQPIHGGGGGLGDDDDDEEDDDGYAYDDVHSTSTAPDDGHLYSPTLGAATAQPSSASASSPQPMLPSLNLAHVLRRTPAGPVLSGGGGGGDVAHASTGSAPGAAAVPVLSFASLPGRSLPPPPQTGPVRGSAAMAAQQPQEVAQRGLHMDDRGDDDDADDREDNYDDGFDETDERRMSEDRVKRLRQVAPYATEILPWLFVGGETAAKDRAQLLSKGITAVVNTVAFNVPNHFEDCLRYLSLNLQDTPDEPIFSLFPYVNAFIEQARLEGGRVFIHCHQGVSRSCSFAIGYIMWNNGLCYDSAYELVRSKRLVCSPNSGFYVNLRCWEVQLARPKFNNAFVYVPHSKMFLLPFSFRQVYTFLPAVATTTTTTGTTAEDGPNDDHHFHVVHPLMRLVVNSATGSSLTPSPTPSLGIVPTSSSASPSPAPPAESQGATTGTAPVIAGENAEYVLDTRLCYGFLFRDSVSDHLRGNFFAGPDCPTAIVTAAQAQWHSFVHFNYFRGYVPLSSILSPATTPKADISAATTPVDETSSATRASRPLTPVPMEPDSATSVNRHAQEVTYAPVPELAPSNAAHERLHGADEVDALVRRWAVTAMAPPPRRSGRPLTPRSGNSATSSGAVATSAGWPHCVLGTDALAGALVEAHGGIHAVGDTVAATTAAPVLESEEDGPPPRQQTWTSLRLVTPTHGSEDGGGVTSHSAPPPLALSTRPTTAPQARTALPAAVTADGLSVGSRRAHGEAHRQGRIGGGGGGASTPRAGGGGPKPGPAQRRRASMTSTAPPPPSASLPALPFLGDVQPQPQTPPTANRGFQRSAGSGLGAHGPTERWATAGPALRGARGTALGVGPDAPLQPHTPADRQAARRKSSVEEARVDTRPGSARSSASASSGVPRAAPRLADVEVYPYPFHAESREHDVVYIEDLAAEACYAIAVPGFGAERIHVFLWFGEQCELNRDAVRHDFLDVFATPDTANLDKPSLILSDDRFYPSVKVDLVESSLEPDELLTAM